MPAAPACIATPQASASASAAPSVAASIERTDEECVLAGEHVGHESDGARGRLCGGPHPR